MYVCVVNCSFFFIYKQIDKYVYRSIYLWCFYSVCICIIKKNVWLYLLYIFQSCDLYFCSVNHSSTHLCSSYDELNFSRFLKTFHITHPFNSNLTNNKTCQHFYAKSFLPFVHYSYCGLRSFTSLTHTKIFTRTHRRTHRQVYIK